jgi:hypothetical protein
LKERSYLQYLLKQAIHHVYGRQLEILGLSLASKLAIQPRTTNELWPILLLLHVNLVTYRSVAVEREHFPSNFYNKLSMRMGDCLKYLSLVLLGLSPFIQRVTIDLSPKWVLLLRISGNNHNTHWGFYFGRKSLLA